MRTIFLDRGDAMFRAARGVGGEEGLGSGGEEGLGLRGAYSETHDKTTDSGHHQPISTTQYARHNDKTWTIPERGRGASYSTK